MPGNIRKTLCYLTGIETKVSLTFDIQKTIINKQTSISGLLESDKQPMSTQVLARHLPSLKLDSIIALYEQASCFIMCLQMPLSKESLLC